MSCLTETIDWLSWYERWDQMLACYNPSRASRVHLLVTFPDLPRDAPLRLLDLGAGPGSTTLTLLQHLPYATVVAVEADPVLVRMGQEVMQDRGLSDQVQFLQADLRDPSWWSGHVGRFDLVVSATALHWLSADSYRAVCHRICRSLRPGGWFMNYDHLASIHPELQDRYNDWRRERCERAFSALGADTWETYWAGLARALGEDHLGRVGDGEDLFEGTDEGYPKPLVLEVLERAGLELVDVYWQELGEAIVGGRRPER